MFGKEQEEEGDRHYRDDDVKRTATTADYDGPYVGLEEAPTEFDTELERQLAACDLAEQASDDTVGEAGRPWSEVRPEFIALIEKTFPQAG